MNEDKKVNNKTINNKQTGSDQNNKLSQFNEFEERVLDIRRVSKKTKGGNTIGFTALVIVGDKNGTIGTGYGKAPNVTDAISKGIDKAKKSLVKINLKNGTISHEVSCKYKSAKVLLKPAPEGTGIIAGGVIRQVVELAGVENVSSKMLGANNKIGNVRCTIDALTKLRRN